jgi:tyrosinase
MRQLRKIIPFLTLGDFKMNNATTSRRVFMKTGVGALAAGLVARFSSDVFAQPAPPALRVRQSVTSLNPNGSEIAALKAGVSEMKRRTNANANDPTGWRGQALIHQNHCPHANFFFLPWHRAYLYHFEQICRDASGVADFVLPYWDWSADRELPSVFWGAGNSLSHAGRGISQTSQASLFAVGTNIMTGILQSSSFTNIASSPPNPLEQRRRATEGALEGGPHNYIHGFVAGDMSTYMSPLDPCFWLHHANIDRIWAEWTDRHPNGNISDTGWRGWNFANNFVDVSGNSLPNVTVGSMLSTYDLGYRYNTQSPIPPGNPTPSPLVRPLFLAQAPNNALLTGAAPLATEIDLGTDIRREINTISKTRIDDIWNAKKKAPSVSLTVEGVRPPKDLNVVIRVFINCNYLSRETPAIDPHYVGSIAFFEHGDHGDGGAHAEDSTQSYSFDLTSTIQDLASVNAYNENEPIEVQLLPVPIHGDAVYSEDISIKGYKIEYSESESR